MTTSVKEADGKFHVTLSGELDTSTAHEAEVALQPLLGILKQARSVGSRVVLKNVNEIVRDVLDLTGFITIFEFE